MVSNDNFLKLNTQNIYRKTFPAEVSALADALGFVEERLEAVGCPLHTVMQISICVEEMFVNVANYAYPEDAGEVELVVDAQNARVSITLIDSGAPFNPLELEEPDITLSAEERPVGGLGIFMVKKSMDEVYYERKDGKNIFQMIKYF